MATVQAQKFFHQKVKLIQRKTWIFTLQHKLLSFWKHLFHQILHPNTVEENSFFSHHSGTQHAVFDSLIFVVEEPKTCLKMLLNHKRKSDFCTTDCKDVLLNPMNPMLNQLKCNYHHWGTAWYTLIQKARPHQTKDPCPRIPSIPQWSMAVILKGVLRNKRQFIMTCPVHSHTY